VAIEEETSPLFTAQVYVVDEQSREKREQWELIVSFLSILPKDKP